MAVGSLFERYGARKHPTLAGYEFDCGRCGQPTYRKPQEAEAQLTRLDAAQKRSAAFGNISCSQECRSAFHESFQVEEPCLTCGKRVRRPPSLVSDSRRIFCSDACRDTFGILSVRCCWPGCSCEMPARRHEHAKLGTLWKVDLRKGGQYARYPLCSDHTALVKQHLPERCRVQMGHTHWFKDPERDLGTRGITNDAAKLMIWSKTAGRCASCDCALSMTEKPRRWHIDHVVPVFRGGRTTFGNLMPMCEPCHRIKSGPERAEAGRTRHREHKARRWLTHPEKDALIASLHSEIDLLRLELAKVRSGHDGDEAGQHRRVPREP